LRCVLNKKSLFILILFFTWFSSFSNQLFARGKYFKPSEMKENFRRSDYSQAGLGKKRNGGFVGILFESKTEPNFHIGMEYSLVNQYLAKIDEAMALGGMIYFVTECDYIFETSEKLSRQMKIIMLAIQPKADEDFYVNVETAYILRESHRSFFNKRYELEITKPNHETKLGISSFFYDYIKNELVRSPSCREWKINFTTLRLLSTYPKAKFNFKDTFSCVEEPLTVDEVNEAEREFARVFGNFDEYDNYIQPPQEDMNPPPVYDQGDYRFPPVYDQGDYRRPSAPIPATCQICGIELHEDENLQNLYFEDHRVCTHYMPCLPLADSETR
jgi:hypothetical protein